MDIRIGVEEQSEAQHKNIIPPAPAVDIKKIDGKFKKGRIEMKPEFAHYWQEGIILNEEEREHQQKIRQAMNQGLVYTVPDDSPLNGHVSTALSKRELEEMMLREHDTPSPLMAFFFDDGDEDRDTEDDELAQRLHNREPSETEPAVFLTQADYDAAISWIFFQ